MTRYLVDVNLPYYFSLWNHDDYIHQADIDDTWTDKQIRKYAKEENLIIITKDTDFLQYHFSFRASSQSYSSENRQHAFK